jgi:hypothetical protein
LKSSIREFYYLKYKTGLLFKHTTGNRNRKNYLLNGKTYLVSRNVITQMKPILLIILVVATCNNSDEYNAPVKESCKIEVSTTPDSIYTVTGRLNGLLIYNRLSMYPNDTLLMVDEAKNVIFEVLDQERAEEAEVITSYGVFDLFRD